MSILSSSSSCTTLQVNLRCPLYHLLCLTQTCVLLSASMQLTIAAPPAAMLLQHLLEQKVDFVFLACTKSCSDFLGRMGTLFLLLKLLQHSKVLFCFVRKGEETRIQILTIRDTDDSHRFPKM